MSQFFFLFFFSWNPITIFFGSIGFHFSGSVSVSVSGSSSVSSSSSLMARLTSVKTNYKLNADKNGKCGKIHVLQGYKWSEYNFIFYVPALCRNTFFVIFVGFFLHFVFLIVQKYRPVWVSDLVPYQNQHNGFSSILYCSTVSNPTKSRCLKKEVQTGFYLPPLGSTEK